MTETNDSDTDTDDSGDLGGVLGEVGLDYGDDEAGDTPESNETDSEGEASDSDPPQASDDSADADEQSSDESESGSGADDGPFAPDPGMQLTKSFGTKLTPPEKEFIELYVEFSDEYDNPGAFLRKFVKELRREYGEEVMRRKEALEELKGGF
ncbi:hypothetical protein [Halococcus salifodinae]|uniref:Uncharacterized protein n=1 Tax=Halococcus salifodinae DSM 8989 TaxID=1227456 RepID=M0MQ90_9EURY|nr:hypothetical protein [Halococcus salifodinae]EMA47801.1 hypothetical protein C450_20821 [Halococcus salifodinae DSM 8989]